MRFKWSRLPAVLIVAGIAAVIASSAIADGGSVAIGSVAPDFSLKNLNGEEVNLYEVLEDGPVLIDFWALWCKPCLKGLPGTSALQEEFGDEGLTVLTVNQDSPRSLAKVKPYIKSKKFDFEVLLDPNQSLQRIFKFRRIPQVFLIDTDHTIAHAQVGYSHALEDQLHGKVSELFSNRAQAEGS